MISFASKGDYSKATRYFEKLKEKLKLRILDNYGKKGVKALSSATPKKTGLTASSWTYEIEHGDGLTKIIFSNTNVHEYVNIAIILQNGHGTGTGGWVEGRDYINPAIQPVFDKIAEDVWKEVTGI